MSDSMGEDIIKKGQELTGFSYEKQKSFHVKVWIFTHGIVLLLLQKIDYLLLLNFYTFWLIFLLQ